MNKITTDYGSWELFNNNDGNWMALPIGNPSFPTFEGSTIGSVSYQAHNWEPVKICTALEETAIRYGNSIGGNKIPDYVPKEEPKMNTNGVAPVVSDGGSSPYYRFKIRSSITGEEIEVETGDVIRAMVGNDFDLGNI